MLEPIIDLSRAYLKQKHFAFQRAVFHQAHLLDHRMSILADAQGVGKTTLIIQKLLDYTQSNRLSNTISQIKKATNAYLACDEMEIGLKYKIPLWLWGFLK